MKKIPQVLIEHSLPNLNTDLLYSLLRKNMCAESCSATVDGDSIGCHECVLSSENEEATKEFRELATKMGISISIVRSI